MEDKKQLEKILVEGKECQVDEWVKHKDDDKAIVFSGKEIYYRRTPQKNYYRLEKYYQEDVE